jgi:hypothetical protein
MNNVLFRRGDQTFIDENVPLNDGQIIFNETDEAIYVDTTINGSVVRKRYGGGNLSRSDIDMALSTISENPVANKVLTELMLQKADVIDDLGTETMNSMKFTELYKIINTRLLNQNGRTLKTIISTNLDLKGLFNTYDERLVSRFIGYYDIYRFYGDDIRLKK